MMGTDNKRVCNNAVVSLRYIMRNGQNEVLEDTTHGPAISYLHGGGNIIPALETELEGMKPGEQKSFFIQGPANERFGLEVIIDQVHTPTADESAKGTATTNSNDNSCGPGCGCKQNN